MPNLVLVAQAARDSSYSAIHIRLLLRKGLVRGEKVGGTWLVDAEDLKRYEDEMLRLGNRKSDPIRDKET